MKKTLAILLSLALVICMIPGAAFASDTSGTGSTVVVTLDDYDVLYDGNAHVPKVTSVTVDGTVITTENGSYTDDIGTGYVDAKTYTVTVTGTYTPSGENAQKTEFKGTVNYTITPVNLANATITVAEGKVLTDVAHLTDKSMFTVTQNGEPVASNLYDLSYETNNGSYRVTAKATAKGTNVVESSVFTAATLRTDITNNADFSEISDQAYTGSAIEPSFSVTVGNKYLTKGTDYSVAYTNNVNGGQTATITITGIGAYTGSASTTFNITQRSISTYGITATVADAVEGKGYPAVVVKDGDTTLKEGTHYSLTYATIDSDSGRVTITGIGSYTGSRTLDYDIVAADKNIADAVVYIGGTTSSYTCYYNGSAQTPSVAVYMNGVQLSSYYYDVVYSDNIKPGYLAAITINGKNGYGGTKTVYFTINSTQLNQYNTTISGVSSSYTYTGLAITPAVSVSVNGKTLTQGVDYTVSYSNNKNISSTYSKARVTITGTNNGYTGTAYVEFTIAGKSLYGCTAYFTNYSSSSAYTGSAVKPAITVKDGTYTTLKEYTDYTISYKDSNGKVVSSMKEAGDYTIVITGKGNYSGELTLSYTITGKDISYYTVTLNKSSVNATGYAQKPTVSSVKYGTTALKSTDYEVSYRDASGKTVTSMTTPGTYKVVVTGKNGYSGSTYATFRIVGEPQEINIAKTSYKVYKDSDSFRISATSTGDGTGYSYVSSNPEVASVSANGAVTIHKIGRAKITVTTTGMKKSDPASDDVYVKVYPDKTKISQKPWTEGKTGSLIVRWDKQDDVTYYQIRYSRYSDFRTGSYLTKTVKASDLAYDTQSTRISGLKSGSRYYVKVRAVKVVYNDYGQELKYYGKWSNWRSAVTK